MDAANPHLHPVPHRQGRVDDHGAPQARTLLRETYFSKISRGFSLPHKIDDKHVVAKFEGGVLKLTLPKRESTGSRPIAIQ